MKRFYILLGYTLLIYYLKASGRLVQYLNMKYAYIPTIAIYILIILTIIQLIVIIKEKKQQKKHHHFEGLCNHDHSHGNEESRSQRLIYALFILPLLTGFLLPSVELDSSIVQTKGFSFPSIEQNDKYSNHQYLAPNTSLYFNNNDYKKFLDKETKSLMNRKAIVINNDNYINDMEGIYRSTEAVLGKKITFSGFVYKEKNSNKNHYFLLRFGIVHCIADSGVFGLLTEFPKNMNLKNDEWIKVTGTLSNVYEPTIKENIPYVKIDKWKKVTKPKETYVYLNRN